MGFLQEKTTHHFVLLSAGGRIEVTANDSADTESIGSIREHLTHIASAFSKGDSLCRPGFRVIRVLLCEDESPRSGIASSSSSCHPSSAGPGDATDLR